MARRMIVCLAASFAASGCATMNPYVQHNRNVSETNINACTVSASDDPAMTYACQMAIRIEKARSEIVTTRSGLTAAIFPLAGIIGYNTARGINAPTNTALAAGGFAGYSAATTLAQPDRIRVYDNGLRSLYCAMSAYQTGIASAAPESARRIALKMSVISVMHLITDYRKRYNDLSVMEKNALDEAELKVDSIDEWLSASSIHRYQQAQLIGFTRTSVGQMNSQITRSLPDNSQLAGDALGALQAALAKRSSPQLPAKDSMKPFDVDTSQTESRSRKMPEDVRRAELDDIKRSANRIIDLYNDMANETPDTGSTLDLSACAYRDLTDIGVKESIGRFMLGPGDVYDGATVEIVRGGQPFTAKISGGVLPYHAASIAPTSPDALTVGLDAEHGILSISAANESSVTDKRRYDILVSDGTNLYGKLIHVDVVTK